MAPDLATYRSAAKSIYEPQLQADITQSQADTNAKIANLNAGKGQIETDYTTAINNLKDSILQETGKISQLYSERLGGMFSGLQGNDMGMMFSKSNQQQATIESTRANKLAEITTGITNLQNSEIANESALKSKYQGAESKYANDAYTSAVKDYNTNQYRNAQLSISRQRLADSEAAAANKIPSVGQGAQQMDSWLSSVVGKDNYVSPQNFGKAYQQWASAGLNPNTFISYFSRYVNPNNKNYKYYLPGSVGDPLAKSKSLADQIVAAMGG